MFICVEKLISMKNCSRIIFENMFLILFMSHACIFSPFRENFRLTHVSFAYNFECFYLEQENISIIKKVYILLYTENNI